MKHIFSLIITMIFGLQWFQLYGSVLHNHKEPTPTMNEHDQSNDPCKHVPFGIFNTLTWNSRKYRPLIFASLYYLRDDVMDAQQNALVRKMLTTWSSRDITNTDTIHSAPINPKMLLPIQPVADGNVGYGNVGRGNVRDYSNSLDNIFNTLKDMTLGIFGSKDTRLPEMLTDTPPTDTTVAPLNDEDVLSLKQTKSKDLVFLYRQTVLEESKITTQPPFDESEVDTLSGLYGIVNFDGTDGYYGSNRDRESKETEKENEQPLTPLSVPKRFPRHEHSLHIYVPKQGMIKKCIDTVTAHIYYPCYFVDTKTETTRCVKEALDFTQRWIRGELIKHPIWIDDDWRLYGCSSMFTDFTLSSFLQDTSLLYSDLSYKEFAQCPPNSFDFKPYQDLTNDFDEMIEHRGEWILSFG